MNCNNHVAKFCNNHAVKQGTNLSLAVEFSHECEDDFLDSVEKIEFIFKQKDSSSADIKKSSIYLRNGRGDATRVPDKNIILVPFTISDTYLFEDNHKFYMDTRVYFIGSEENPPTNIVELVMNKTLFENGYIPEQSTTHNKDIDETEYTVTARYDTDVNTITFTGLTGNPREWRIVPADFTTNDYASYYYVGGVKTSDAATMYVVYGTVNTSSINYNLLTVNVYPIYSNGSLTIPATNLDYYYIAQTDYVLHYKL